MKAADINMRRTVRRELGRRPVESSRVEIEVRDGHITLTGSLTRLPSRPGVNLQRELDSLTQMLMRDRKVRDVTSRLLLREKKMTPRTGVGTGTRGRMRPSTRSMG